VNTTEPEIEYEHGAEYAQLRFIANSGQCQQYTRWWVTQIASDFVYFIEFLYPTQTASIAASKDWDGVAVLDVRSTPGCAPSSWSWPSREPSRAPANPTSAFRPNRPPSSSAIVRC